MSGNWDFNKEECYFNVFIYRVDKRDETYEEIGNDTMHSVTICNDIIMTSPTIEIKLNDPFAHLISNYPEDGNTIVDFIYKKDKVALKHSFVITNIEHVDVRVEESGFVLKGQSHLSCIFNSRVIYSTGGISKSPILCIDDILSKNFKHFYENLEKNKMLISPRFINYITPTTHSMREVINYLLLNSHHENTGLNFLYFNIFDDKLKILNTKTIFESEEIPEYNYVKLPSKFGTGNTAEAALDFNRNCFLKKKDIDMFKLDNIGLTSFDQTSRSWSTKDYPREKSLQFLPKTKAYQKYSPNKKFIPTLKEIGGVRHMIQIPKTEWEHYKRMISFFRFSNVIQLESTGIMARNAGEMFFIDVDKPDQPLAKQYLGKHLITRLYNIFDVFDHKFRQDISLVRTDGEIRDGGRMKMEQTNKDYRRK